MFQKKVAKIFAFQENPFYICSMITNTQKQNTMTIQINKQSNESGYIGADVTCGKVNTYVLKSKNGFVVCVNNAAHKAWKGAGRHFNNYESALAAYKSSEVKAAINYVNSIN